MTGQPSLPGFEALVPERPPSGVTAEEQRARRRAAVMGEPVPMRRSRVAVLLTPASREARANEEALRIARLRADAASAEVPAGMWALRPKTRGDCWLSRIACLQCGGYDDEKAEACGRCRGTGLHFVRGLPGGGVEPFDLEAYRAWVEARDRGEAETPPLKHCPWASCSQNLGLDVEKRGRIRLQVVGRHGCALDAAEAGGLTHRAIGRATGRTKQAAQKAEEAALAGLPKWARRKFEQHAEAGRVSKKRAPPVIDDSDFADSIGMAAE